MKRSIFKLFLTIGITMAIGGCSNEENMLPTNSEQDQNHG